MINDDIFSKNYDCSGLFRFMMNSSTPLGKFFMFFNVGVRETVSAERFDTLDALFENVFERM